MARLAVTVTSPSCLLPALSSRLMLLVLPLVTLTLARSRAS
jgi:hypothetical protein